MTTIREQFKAARRHLRTDPSLFNPPPQGITVSVFNLAAVTLPQGYRLKTGSYGCKCKSCKSTSRYTLAGFSKWPQGEAKGKRASDAEYNSHVSHMWQGVHKSLEFKPGQAPQYPAWTRGNGPIQPAPKFVHDWINRDHVKFDLTPVRKPTPRLVALARELRRAA